MGSSNADSFAACIEDCAATNGCVDVSYVWGTCYKKNTLNEGGAAGHVWSAKLVASSTEGSGTDTKTDTKTDTTKVEPITCPASNGKTPSISSGGTYEITCGMDHWGGDFKSLDTASFDLCLEACDKNDACKAVSYVAPSCYLKNEVNTGAAAGHVWGAVVKKAAKNAFEFFTIPDKALEAGATESVMAEVMTLPSPPLATLGPVSPPGINMGGLGVLTADKVSELWFGGSADAMKDDESGAVTVRLTVDYKYPSIVLDHSIYIKNVDCASGSLQAKFDNIIAFSHAADTWPAKVPLLFITSAKSCGNGDQNSFWLARSVTFDTGASTFSASGATVELADVYNEMEIDFGKIELRNSTGNGTSSTDDAASSCGKPSSPFLDDLPAVACGTSFDKSLDDTLGYYAASGDDEQHVLASAGVDTSNSTAVDVKRDLAKRGWFTSLVKKAVTTVVKAAAVVVKQVATAVVQVAKTAASVAVTVVKATVNVGIALAVNAAKLVVFAVTGEYSNSLTLPIDIGTGNSLVKTTPWEGTTGFKFYDYSPEREGKKWKASKVSLAKVASEFKLLPGEESPEPKIELWAVDCGAKGKFVATGSISATPLSGLKKAQVGVHGNMYVGAFLGVNAFTTYEKTVRKDLFVKGLPGWEIPKIVSLGPRVILGASATISVEAEGQLLTGVSLNWPNFQATLDFVDQSKSSQSGWTPEITKKFDAHGALTAKAALGLPVTLSFGINILDGRFEKAVNLTDTPAITAEAKLEFDVGTSKTQLGSDSCQGIEWDISLTNELRIDAPNTPGWVLNEKKFAELASGCIGRTREETPTTSSAPVSSTTTTPTPTPTAFACPSAHGKTFTDTGPNKNVYTVTCGVDARDSDITTSAQSSLDACINWCGTIPKCVGVAWGSTVNVCWAKSAWPDKTLIQAGGQPRDVAFIAKPPTFTILSMVYADRDITAYAQGNVLRGTQLVIETNTIVGWANGDPWPGQAKSISMLYTYGQETRTFVAAGGTGTYTINPGPIGIAPNSQLVPGYEQMSGVQNINIIAAAYGRNAITARNVYQSMYNAIRSQGGRWQFTNENFAWDTWVGIGKTGTIWYRNTDNGYLYAMSAREGNYNAFQSGRWAKRQTIGETPQQAPEAQSPQPIGEAAPAFTPSQNTPTAGSSDSTPIAVEPTDAPNQTPSPTPTASASSEASESATSVTLSANSTSSSATPTPSSNATDITISNLDIVDTTNSLKLNPSKDGNLFFSLLGDSTDLSNLTSGSFAGDAASKTIMGDSSDRLLHYYPDVLASSGASRLRLAAWDKLPKSAKLIMLSQVEVEGEKMMLGIDTAGNYLWPFVCGIKGQLNKLFLVKDPQSGGAVLQKENMRFTVTGGEASNCEPVALMLAMK
jgi:hypothetical protein